MHQLDGLHIRMHKSRTDQEGRGVVRALRFTASHTSCPPCTWRRWAQVRTPTQSQSLPYVCRVGNVVGQEVPIVGGTEPGKGEVFVR